MFKNKTKTITLLNNIVSSVSFLYAVDIQCFFMFLYDFKTFPIKAKSVQGNF